MLSAAPNEAENFLVSVAQPAHQSSLDPPVFLGDGRDPSGRIGYRTGSRRLFQSLAECSERQRADTRTARFQRMTGALEHGKFVSRGCRLEVGDQLRRGLQVKRNHPVHKAGPAISLDIGKLRQDLTVERRVAIRLG